MVKNFPQEFKRKKKHRYRNQREILGTLGDLFRRGNVIVSILRKRVRGSEQERKEKWKERMWHKEL